jgi:hypothetical protein
MVLNNRYTLVLNNVLVGNDVVTGTVVNGLVSTRMQIEASPFSTRHPSHSMAQIDQQTDLRQRDADFNGATLAAARAGRPASCLGAFGQWPLPLPAAARTRIWRSSKRVKKPAMARLVWHERPGLPSASTRG